MHFGLQINDVPFVGFCIIFHWAMHLVHLLVHGGRRSRRFRAGVHNNTAGIFVQIATLHIWIPSRARNLHGITANGLEHMH